MLFVESASVGQPTEKHLLGSPLRLTVVGMVKTLSCEAAYLGITSNIIGPVIHETVAINKLFSKKINQSGMPLNDIRHHAIERITIGEFGKTENFARLAFGYYIRQGILLLDNFI